MEKWGDWYTQYMDRDTSLSSGEREGLLAEKYFTTGQIDVLGTAFRRSTMHFREVTNSSFQQYCYDNSRPFPSDYRQIRPTLEAGYKSTAKYDRQQPLLNEVAWVLAGDWTERHYYAYVGGTRVKSQDDVLKEMDLTTSCGYPWSLKFTDKKSMLLDIVAVRVLGDFWDQLILPEMEMLPIWTVSQKREIRPIEKVIASNHRTFTASPIELSVSSNRLCLDYNEKFYDSHNITWSSVGMTKFLSGWHRLYTRLNKHPNGYELDETSYDASLFARALYGQRDSRWRVMDVQDRTKENQLRMWRVYDNIVHSVMIMEDGLVVQKHTGGPSGSVNTVVDNTTILTRLLSYAWLLLAPSHMRNYNDFQTNVEAALYGDDVTYTVSDAAAQFYHPTAISEIWTSIGVVTRTPDPNPRPVSQLTFLSNGFVFDKDTQHWMPCPETGKVLASLAYGSELGDVRWHFLRACALRLDAYYNVEVRDIIDSYINYLNHNYRDELIGDVTLRPGVVVKMSDIRNLWKPHVWIERLYTGRESLSAEDQEILRVVDISAHQHPIKINYTHEIKQSLISQVRATDNSYKMSGKIAKRAVKKAVRKAVNKNKNYKKGFKHYNKKKRSPRVVNFKTRNSRFTDSGQNRFTRPPQAADYVKALTDPFFAPAPKLGFGTFIPTAKHTTWLERTTNIGSTANWAVVTCVPGITNTVQVYQSTTANINAALNTITPSGYSMSNATTIAALSQLGRPINWAVRVKVRAAATALPGTLGFVYVADESRTDIELQSAAQLTALASYRPCTATSSGQIGGEIQYRPADLSDFDFYAAMVTTSSPVATVQNMQMICVATGWTATAWDMEISIIGHIETLGGVDAAGETDSEPDLVDGGVTIDSVATLLASAGEPIKTSLEALQALDNAHSNINRIRSGHSMAGMMRNFANGMASNTVTPVSTVGVDLGMYGPSSIKAMNTELEQRQLRDVINALKDEQDKLLESVAEMRREYGLSVKNDPIRVHTQTPVPDELSDYEEEKKVSEDEMKKLSTDERSQVVLSRSMFNTLLGK